VTRRIGSRAVLVPHCFSRESSRTIAVKSKEEETALTGKAITSERAEAKRLRNHLHRTHIQTFKALRAAEHAAACAKARYAAYHQTVIDLGRRKPAPDVLEGEHAAAVLAWQNHTPASAADEIVEDHLGGICDAYGAILHDLFHKLQRSGT
jgi:hypothetical protein